MQRQLTTFLDAIDRAWRTRTILYVPDSYQRIVARRFADRPIWIRAIASEPKRASYGGWLLWQYTDSGHVPGIPSAIDLSALRSGASLAALRPSGGT